MNRKLSWDQLKNIEVIYGKYGCVRSLLDHVGIMNGELAAAKKTEEEAVRKLGEAGLELSALKKQLPETVELPKAVAEAFDRVLNSWGQRYSEERIAGFLLNPEGFVTGNDDAKTLRQYASVEPFKYMQAIANGYAVEQSPDEYVFQEYVELIGNDQYDAADAILMAIEKLAPGKADLVEKMRAVERLPF